MLSCCVPLSRLSQLRNSQNVALAASLSYQQNPQVVDRNTQSGPEFLAHHMSLVSCCRSPVPQVYLFPDSRLVAALVES